MPKSTPDTETQIKSLLARHSPEVRALVERLRRVVREAAPEATEAAYLGWHAIGYRHPAQGYFCSLFPQSEGVQVVFEFGALLPDPGGLLEGEGKQVRFVSIRSQRAIRPAALKALIKAALDLPVGRGVKLGLLKAKARPAPRR